MGRWAQAAGSAATNTLIIWRAWAGNSSSSPCFGNDYVQELYWDRISRWAVIRAYARRLGLLLGRERYDLIWLQREALPWFPAWVEKALLRGRAPVVIDLDDAWFHRYDLHRWRVVRWLLSDKVDRIVRQARLVVVGNDYLAERMRVAGARRVEQLPSVVDARNTARRARGTPRDRVWSSAGLDPRPRRIILPPSAPFCGRLFRNPVSRGGGGPRTINGRPAD